MSLLPSCMSMWHFSLLGKLLKPWVTFLGGCGVNSRMYVRTHEAASVDLTSPLLRALGSSSTEFKWMPPERPNGVTTSHVTHRWGVCGWGCLLSWACRSTHIFHFAQGAEMHPCSMEHLPVRTELESVNSDTLPKDHCAAFCGYLFDSWDPRALDFHLCDSSLSVAAFASHFVQFLFVCLFAFVQF